MRYLLFVLILFINQAHAGSASCSNTSALNWSQDNPYTTLDSSECVVSAAQEDSGTTALLAYLPTAPNDGDTFTLKDTTDFSLDVCQTWYSGDVADGGDGNTYSGCYDAGFTFDDGHGTLTGLSTFYFTSCDVGDVDPGTNPCGPGDLPSYYGDYPKVRYSFTATYNASEGAWDYSDAQL